MRKFIIEDPYVNYPIPGVPDDDLKFVYAAFQYDTDCLVTGNIKHFSAVSNVIKVMTPAEFIKQYEI
jgi:predicted nucleic acid-binding protein